MKQRTVLFLQLKLALIKSFLVAPSTPFVRESEMPLKHHLVIRCRKGAVFWFGWVFMFVAGFFCVGFVFNFPSSSFIPFNYEHIFLVTLFFVCLHALLIPKRMEDFWH